MWRNTNYIMLREKTGWNGLQCLFPTPRHPGTNAEIATKGGMNGMWEQTGFGDRLALNWLWIKDDPDHLIFCLHFPNAGMMGVYSQTKVVLVAIFETGFLNCTGWPRPVYRLGWCWIWWSSCLASRVWDYRPASPPPGSRRGFLRHEVVQNV